MSGIVGTNDVLYWHAHHNWENVVCRALDATVDRKNLKLDDKIVLKKCVKISELPSQSNSAKRQKYHYALFRIETISISVWADSLAFTKLDSKDCLYSELSLNNSQECMPFTLLIPWDIDDSNLFCKFPTWPALLKAATGSGGFGIYRVNCPDDVIKIAKYHKINALKHDNFLETLKAHNDGRIPSWSLQQFLPSVKFEVRLPYWEQESEMKSHNSTPSSSVVDFEEACCDNTTAVPYNRNRLKECTERYMLFELPEISHTHDAIMNCVRNAMAALQPTILRTLQRAPSASTICIGSNYHHRRNDVAIAGIDLLLTPSNVMSDCYSDPSTLKPYTDICPYTAKLLELNNNPAMPGFQKHMSKAYEEHIVQFAGNLITLGLADAGHLQDNCGFDQLW